MTYGDIKAARERIRTSPLSETSPIRSTEFLTHEHHIVAVLDRVNGLRGELDLSYLQQIATIVAEGRVTDNDFKVSHLTRERRKSHYIMSAVAVMAAHPTKQHRPARLFVSYLGKFKDAPHEPEHAAHLEKFLARYPEPYILFGPGFTPATPYQVGTRISKLLSHLNILTNGEGESVSRGKFHEARKSVRKLAMTHAILLSQNPDLPITRDAWLFDRLSSHMGQQNELGRQIGAAAICLDATTTDLVRQIQSS